MKKGFTLLELLCVIIILAIITLIATPIILNVIDNATRSANKSEVGIILNSANTLYATTYLDSTKSYLKDSFNGVTNLYEFIDMTRDKPHNGYLVITSDGKVGLSVLIDDFCYIKNVEDNVISEYENIDNCELEINADSSLEYETLEYLISDGNQYFDTGLYNTGNYKIEDYVYLTGDNSWLFGGRTSIDYTFGVHIWNTTNVFSAYGGHTTSSQLTFDLSFNKWIEVSYDLNNFIIDEKEYIQYGQELIPDEYQYEIRLGGMNQSYAIDDRNFKGYRKRTIITDMDTMEVVRDFIPAYIEETGEIGYIDLVNNELYISEGEKDFILP